MKVKEIEDLTREERLQVLGVAKYLEYKRNMRKPRNEMRVFENQEFGIIRTTEINGEPWFAGKDVAAALGYSNPQKAIRDHVDIDDVTVNDSFTVNGTKGNLINESGLYSLVLSSKLPAAKKFKRWVTSEVLPSIRRDGGYLAVQESLSPAELVTKALQVAKMAIENQSAKIEELTEENQTLQKKADSYEKIKSILLTDGIA